MRADGSRVIFVLGVAFSLAVAAVSLAIALG